MFSRLPPLPPAPTLTPSAPPGRRPDGERPPRSYAAREARPRSTAWILVAEISSVEEARLEPTDLREPPFFAGPLAKPAWSMMSSSEALSRLGAERSTSCGGVRTGGR